MADFKLNDNDLAAIVMGYEIERERIDARIAEIRQILSGGGSEATVAADVAKPRKKRSAAVRRRMALAQRARYAKLKPNEPVKAEVAKPKRKLSAAGRKAIIAGTKKRWAAFKAAQETAKPVVAKKAGPRAPKKAAKKVGGSKPKKVVAMAPGSVAPAAG